MIFGLRILPEGLPDTDAAICFHDARIIHSALVDILHSLKSRKVGFVARRLLAATASDFSAKLPGGHGQVHS